MKTEEFSRILTVFYHFKLNLYLLSQHTQKTKTLWLKTVSGKCHPPKKSQTLMVSVYIVKGMTDTVTKLSNTLALP